MLVYLAPGSQELDDDGLRVRVADHRDVAAPRVDRERRVRDEACGLGEQGLWIETILAARHDQRRRLDRRKLAQVECVLGARVTARSPRSPACG